MNDRAARGVPVPGAGSGRLEELLDEPFPRMLMVQTTSACNSSCSFCPQPLLRRELPQGRMDEALFRRIMEEAGRHDELACINLFLMNEPLVDPRIIEHVELAGASSKQAQISLWTNGIALTAARAEALLGSPLSSLGISLHAQRPETYERLTGRRDFYRVLRQVVHFVERRQARRPEMTVVLRFVGASMLMSAEERSELAEFWAEGNVILDIDEGYLSRAGNVEAPGAVGLPRQSLAGCRALGGPKQAHILYTGQVVLCCMDYRRETSLGNVAEESIEQVWRGQRRRELLQMLYGRAPLADSFLCSRCELALSAHEAARGAAQGEQDHAIDDGLDSGAGAGAGGLPVDAVWAAV